MIFLQVNSIFLISLFNSRIFASLYLHRPDIYPTETVERQQSQIETTWTVDQNYPIQFNSIKSIIFQFFQLFFQFNIQLVPFCLLVPSLGRHQTGRGRKEPKSRPSNPFQWPIYERRNTRNNTIQVILIQFNCIFSTLTWFLYSIPQFLSLHTCTAPMGTHGTGSRKPKDQLKEMPAPCTIYIWN